MALGYEWHPLYYLIAVMVFLHADPGHSVQISPPSVICPLSGASHLCQAYTSIHMMQGLHVSAMSAVHARPQNIVSHFYEYLSRMLRRGKPLLEHLRLLRCTKSAAVHMLLFQVY